MDSEPPEDSTDSLRRRIAALEADLRRARAEREEAQAELAKAEYEHSSARNFAAYGRSDDVIFVQPGQDDGYISKRSKGTGVRAKVFRFMVRYDIDQFLQRPRLHQWLNRGHLYREAGELQTSRFELFFDLLFVGMVHQISEAAADLPTGLGFARYVLTFTPAFSIWVDVRDIANQFANDDVTQRAYILWTMMLLVGYANNASAIRFGDDGAEGGLTQESFASMRWALGFLALAKLSRVLLYIVYGTFLPLSRKPLLVNSIPAAVQAVIFFAAIFTSLHATIALAAWGIILDHALRIAGVLLVKTLETLGRKIEKRRLKQLNKLRSATAEEDPSSAASTPAVEMQMILARVRTVNSSTTAINEPAVPLENIRLCRVAASREDFRIPAINIEHHVERLGAFVTIMLGEIVVSVFFAATSPVGLNRESGRAFLCLMIAFNYNWMYFDSQACQHFTHAIRRHWLTGFLWTTLHLPLCMALLLASSAINRLVTSDSVAAEPGLRWFFGAGLGASLWIMATLGVLHRNLDNEEGLNPRKTRIKHIIGRKVALGTRYTAGVAMILVPLAEDLSSIVFLAIYVAITAFLIIEETFARIERREQEIDLGTAGGLLESSSI